MKEEVKSDWDNARLACEKIQDTISDIQISMKNGNINENTIFEYGKAVDLFINYVIMEDRKESLLQLIKLYDYSDIFNANCIKDQKVYLTKKMQYSSIISLIYLETENIEELKKNINVLVKNIEEINANIKDQNNSYTIERINNVIQTLNNNIENEDIENIRLKLVILIDLVQILENNL